MAALLSAKLAVEQSDYATAKSRLQWVIDHPKKSELTAIAAARLAQILLAEDDSEAAATVFNTLTDSEQARFPGLKGDILLATGDVDSARAAYEQALEQALEFGIDSEPVQLKLDNLNFLQAQTR
ncbi:MAG: tetratricopeptide repeat protein, partial [Gammaproteobacteria bacterium]